MRTHPRRVRNKPPSTRASASLPPEVYEALQEIARRKKVSVAWVIRDAAERYICSETETEGRKIVH